ncbi:hypothetical protein K443DRAFT_5957 [Laccaria amethystina LaAM-08-1]|uniref:DDE-1 domain-containing protein n=1 Tax=Laccaria amethystina LaAM-08-1 TaxID=1095629 RepID=A0A0C9XCP9_9AGAR|nr:hypothetical protein K443DRAFT_5957 [Laccaria amethystina LaAM-08-1]
MKDFDPQTKEKAAGETRVLLMDGHSSHFTADLLEYCLANNIEVYGYPPHCTHALQGLDVVCFAKMKECWKEAINEHEKLHHRGVNKEDFAKVWGGAYIKAFTEENIRSAFKKTGIWPYNPDVITPEQMKPAEATSTRSTFPLPQSSPVRVFMGAFNSYEFTEAGLYPDSLPQAGPSNFPGSHADQPEPQSDTTLSDSPDREYNPRKRQIDPTSNPDLATPSKRMRCIGVGLASTASGSFLVKKARVTHLQMEGIIKDPVIEHIPDELPLPDWKRCNALAEALGHAKVQLAVAHEIMSGQSGQLIVQNMGMEAMHRTLFEKEQPKNNDRTAMFPKGFGRHATDPEWVQQKWTLEDEGKQKEVDKAQRKVTKAGKKARKVELEERWKAVCVAHEEAIVKWKAMCETFKGRGVAAKNLLKKPKRVLKVSLVEESEDEDEGGGSDEESESDDER